MNPQKTHTPGKELSDELRYIMSTVGYILPYRQPVTGPEFADLVAHDFDTSNPRTAWAVGYLKTCGGTFIADRLRGVGYKEIQS